VGEQISRADLTSAAEQLWAVLAAVPADLDQAAYLRGAADTMAMLAARADGSGECPKHAGLSYEQIAERLGFTDRRAAHRGVARGLAEPAVGEAMIRGLAGLCG
jgi:hypothetical protein